MTSDVASERERAALDALLGAPASAWDGGPRTDLDGRVALGGLQRAAESRHLLLPALWAIQDEIGLVGHGAVNYIAERLSIPPADVYGVASFYSLIATEEQQPRVAHVCDDIACRNKGGSELLAELADSDSVRPGPCLGQCDRAPAVYFQLAGEQDIVLAPTTTQAVRDVLELNGKVPDPGDASPSVTSGQRLMRRVGTVDPTDIDDYLASGGFSALDAAIGLGGQSVIEEVRASGLRGRGGAAFPAGVKWKAVAEEPASAKYVVCNADESEPGTFKDRVLIESDPFAIVEAMTVAGFAVGAEKGFFYIRGEYPLGQERFENAVAQARSRGLLGPDVRSAGFAFDIEVRRGAGAYICGEETALFNSIEGYRGEPRQKPPFPTQAGLFGQPTLINNVETLVNVLHIVSDGGSQFAEAGTAESTGTKIFCLSGNVRNPGAYEAEFGITLRELIENSGGTVGEFRAALVGGAAGTFLMEDKLDLPLTFEATRAVGASLGSGVVMVFNTETDFTDLLLRIGAFFRDESCGQCVPCRVGTMRQEESLIRLSDGSDGEQAVLADLALVMSDSSICGFGHAASWAVQSAIQQGLIGVGG